MNFSLHCIDYQKKFDVLPDESLPGVWLVRYTLHRVPPDIGQEGHHTLWIIGWVERSYGRHSHLNKIISII